MVGSIKAETNEGGYMIRFIDYGGAEYEGSDKHEWTDDLSDGVGYMSMGVGARIMLRDSNGDYAGYRVEYPQWYHDLESKKREA